MEPEKYFWQNAKVCLEFISARIFNRIPLKLFDDIIVKIDEEYEIATIILNRTNFQF